MFHAFFGLLLMAFGAADDAHARGLELYRQQKYAEAIPALEEASRSEKTDSPEYRESMLLIGQSYFMLSQAPKAIPWLERVPSVNEANYMLGYAYLQSSQLDASRTAFARLFGLAPQSAAAHLMAAQMMLKKDYEEQAVAEANNAIALDAKIPEAHFVLSEAAIHRGRIEEAVGLLERELALNPGYAMAWYRLGDAYTRQQNWQAAIPELQRAIWLNPDFSGPYILLGKCYFKSANYTNAEGILKQALKLDPRNYAANYLLGQTLVAEGKKDEGRAVLENLKGLQRAQ